MISEKLKFLLKNIGLVLICIGIIFMVIIGIMIYNSAGENPILFNLFGIGGTLFLMGIIIVRILMIQEEEPPIDLNADEFEHEEEKIEEDESIEEDEDDVVF
ncbi:MAG: hypothetical protein ACTSQJ_07080 [Promethearchaeota archaeon]